MIKRAIFMTTLVALTFSAAAFQTSLDTEKDLASPNSPAEFKLGIENEAAVNNTYSLSLLSPKSSWFYYPSTVHVPAGENRTVNITVSPVEESIQRRYSFSLKVREHSSEEQNDMKGFFQVKQPYSLQVTDISKNDDSFLPGEVIRTSLKLKNLENNPIDNYRVEARYENKTRTETGTSILPGGERLYDFNFRVSKNATPGERTIHHTVYLNEEIEKEIEQKVEISEVENISTERETDNRILTITETETATNNGNSDANTSLTMSVPSYLSSITFPEPEPDNEETVEGETIYTWKKQLEKGETTSVTYTVRYWIPLFGSALLIAGIIAIKKIGSDITVKKTAESDGKEVKINIEIINGSEKTFERLKLEEFIPDIATVDERFEMNTPKIRKTNEGTKLEWQLDELNPGDQRIIQYKIKPKLEVEEEVDIESAIIKDQNGQKIAESNRTSAEFTPDTT